MKRFALLVTAVSIAVSPVAAEWKYPATRTVDAADTYFGVTYKDPYRWLENLKDPEVESWFKAQATLTDGLLAKIPARDALAKEWMDLDKLKPATYSGITYEHGRLFYKKTRGGENVGKLYYREGWNGTEMLLFDPSTYKPGVTTVIQSFIPSFDGKHVVMGLTASGAEWSELRVLHVSRRELLPDKLYPCWGPSGWRQDNQSFMYDWGKTTDIKSVEIEQNRQSRVHRLGSPIEQDADIFSNASHPELKIEPKEIPMSFIDESFPDYVFSYAATVQNELRIYAAPTSEISSAGVSHWQEISRLSDNIVRGFVPYGEYVYGVTHTGAPKYKVVRTKLKKPDWAHAEVIAPEAKDSVISIGKSRSYLFITYSDGINMRIVKYEFATGKKTNLKLPMNGTVDMSFPDAHSDDCFVVISSWTHPSTRYDYNARRDTWEKSEFNDDVKYPGFDDLVAEEVEVPGHDGTMIPLSIIYKKGMKRDGSNPCILNGYGAYGISMSPWFSTRHSLALHGVVLGFAHPRGGSEKGEAWYKAGYKTTKPNTWKDFISCAEYLVKKGYTNPQKLAGTGTSAGGILISRAITERPDLFRAAICNVGCANAMRMEFSPNGPVNTPEFGTVMDATECKALYEMDGVQHVKAGVKYPALMGVGGWNDPRVAVWEPGKFVAAMQNASISGNPVLMEVNYDNGHFTEEKIVTFRNFASQSAFLLWQTGHKDFQPVN
jgi:prolyl oligopeptidase